MLIFAGDMSTSGVLVHVAGCSLKTFTISATVGLQGQVVRMPIRVEYAEDRKPAVVIQIQKRHKCARFSMDLFSDHEESIPPGVDMSPAKMSTLKLQRSFYSPKILNSISGFCVSCKSCDFWAKTQ